MASFPRIAVLDHNGAEALRYLKLDDEQYYGGTTHDAYRKLFPFAYGPHVLLNTAGMLDLIARIANLDGNPQLAYSLQGTGACYDVEPITREMHADRIARILGCDEQAVRDHYRQVVLIPKETTCQTCPKN